MEIGVSLLCRFENASVELLEETSDNKCAICWEKMRKAKKLKCGHLFHRCVNNISQN